MTAFADLHVPGDRSSCRTRGITLPRRCSPRPVPGRRTTSLGVAAALGLPDGAAETADATVDLCAASSTCPARHGRHRVRVHDRPRRGGRLAARSAAGAGVNLEDAGRPGSWRADRGDRRRPRLRQRAHRHLLARCSRLDETLVRAESYVDAGADGIFVPGMGPDEVRTVVEPIDAPAERPARQAHRPELAALGVSRISTGSLLFRIALGAAERAATELKGTVPFHLSTHRRMPPSTCSPEHKGTVPLCGAGRSSARACRARDRARVARGRRRRPPERTCPRCAGAGRPPGTSGVMCSPRSYPEGRTKT